MFKEHETCERRGQCKLLEKCQRAMNIKIELGHEQQTPGSSSLRYVLETRSCQHEEAIDAAEKVQEFLDTR